jgi:hypothetical protein
MDMNDVLQSKWEVVAKLNPEEEKAFADLEACKAACKELIKNLIAEWELAYTHESAIWDALIEKHDPTGGQAKYVYEVTRGKELRRRLVMLDGLAKTVDRLERRVTLKDYFRSMFNKGDKK